MEDLLNKIKKEWSKDYIIRFIYINLAPFYKRDLNYFLASEEEKYNIYLQGFTNNTPNVVCSTLADNYIDIFSMFNIRAKKIIANSAKIPLFALIVEGDHGWFYLDPLKDLFNCQYGLDPTEFAILPHYETLKKKYPFLISLPKEYIKSIDSALGLIPSLDSFFYLLHLEMTNRNSVCKHFEVKTNNRILLFEKKMNFANSHLINLGCVKGPFERIQLYIYLEKIMFFKTEKKNLRIHLDSNNAPLIEYQSKDTHITFSEITTNDNYKLERKI